MTRDLDSGSRRRDLLRWSGGAFAAAWLLPGCDLLSTKRSEDKQGGEGTGSGTGGKEAPMLAALVTKGTLPAVAKRLPKSPAVVTPLEEVGSYGGTIRMATTLQPSTRFGIVSREGLVEWAPGKTTVAPGLAESWDVSQGGRIYTFHLREGARWSDGHPFTADDLVFYYKSMLLNKELTPVFPDWLVTGGKPGEISKVDDYTVQFKFAAPHGLLLRQLAFRGAMQGAMLQPKHYLSKFHPDFTSKAKLEAMAKEQKLSTWMDLFVAKNTPAVNADRPVMSPWMLSKHQPGNMNRAVAERNPYYWKVDTHGRQLPYIDRLTEEKLDQEVISLRAKSGDLDLAFESINIGDLPAIADSQQDGGFRILRWKSDAPWIAMYLNQSDKDPVLRDLMQNVDFRAGLSHAINRDELNKILYHGAGGTRQPCAISQDDYYVEGTGQRFTEYDPAKANALLDRAGLDNKDGQGFRLRSDGKRLKLVISTFTFEYGGTASATDAYQLVKQHWKQVGVQADFDNIDRVLWAQRAIGNLLDVPGYTVAGFLWDVDPVWYVPTSSTTYWAPAYGHWNETGGKEGMEPPEELRKLQQLYDQMKSETDADARLALGRKILKAHDENVWIIGTVTSPFAPVIANADLTNVLDKAVLSYRLQYTATSGMEQLAYKNPQDHG